ncbi:hypothetical protein [Motilibacter deserti]|uniref:Secreted protein n=1 Tax=Motilibacter deserti TaxID=2714956 RepID=A0ABX0GTX1_9ACTN|nr:hypothetical protein [Motilibacter deserti]NHC14353.1 hypothetical protein [Motilibacter deserti]
MRIRAVIVAAAAAASVLAGAAPAQAERVKPPAPPIAVDLETGLPLEGDRVEYGAQEVPAGTPDAHFDYGTWKWVVPVATVYFNRRETAQIALGGTVISWIPTPYTVWGGRAVAAIAGSFYASGGCLAVKAALAGGWLVQAPWYHNGRWC